MSNSNGGWKPRKIETLTCPSGQVVQVRRPGPEFTLRAQRVVRTFTKDSSKEAVKIAGESDEDFYKRVIAEMSDEEIVAVTALARELVPAITVSPRLVLNPNPDRDEIGPDDIGGNDFWFLFGYATSNFFNLKVPVAQSEVEIGDLETFREEPGVQGDRVDSVHVPVAESERATTDSGLVDSAGA